MMPLLGNGRERVQRMSVRTESFVHNSGMMMGIQSCFANAKNRKCSGDHPQRASAGMSISPAFDSLRVPIGLWERSAFSILLDSI